MRTADILLIPGDSFYIQACEAREMAARYLDEANRLELLALNCWAYFETLDQPESNP